LIDWVWKKINGELENLKYKHKLKDPRIYNHHFGHENSEEITECCDWAENEW
jgi:hypothetical protein